jgi:hypothetical protein
VSEVFRQWGATKPVHDSTSWGTYRPAVQIPERPPLENQTNA